jgi:4-amino-4-deoxy-L-arabinose transferase-like glycosyltransferase
MYLWGIEKDLPYAPQADEFLIVERTIRMAASGNLNPGWLGFPASTIYYPLAVLYHLWFALTSEGRLWAANQNLAGEFETNFEEFYLLGRFLSVAYAIMSIPVIYLLGRRTFGAGVAFLGVGLFIFNPLVIAYVQMVRPDSAAIFFSMVSLWLCIKLYNHPTLLRQLLTGLVIGLSIASRYFMGILTLVLLYVDIVILRQDDHKKQWIGIGAGFLAVGAGFLLSTPYFLIDFLAALHDIIYEARDTHLGADGLSPLGNFIWYLTQAIPNTITWPQMLLLITAYFLIFLRRQFGQLLLSSYAFVFLVGISMPALHWDRWIIPILPIFSMCVAFSLITLITFCSKRLNLSAKAEYQLLSLAIVLVLIKPVYQVILQDIRYANPSTRITAREWILQNLPADSKIAQEFYTAPLDDTDFTVFKAVSLSTSGYTLGEAYQSGYRYVMVSSTMYDRYLAEPDRYPDQVEFYQTLFHQGKLLQKIEPAYFQGGPTIMIYELE